MSVVRLARLRVVNAKARVALGRVVNAKARVALGRVGVLKIVRAL